jgi:hypothetical protein
METTSADVVVSDRPQIPSEQPKGVDEKKQREDQVKSESTSHRLLRTRICFGFFSRQMELSGVARVPARSCRPEDDDGISRSRSHISVPADLSRSQHPHQPPAHSTCKRPLPLPTPTTAPLQTPNPAHAHSQHAGASSLNTRATGLWWRGGGMIISGMHRGGAWWSGGT